MDKRRIASNRNTPPEVLSMLIEDEDEEVRLLVSLNESTPVAALYSQLDFDEIRNQVSKLRQWFHIFGKIDEISEEESIKYSPLQVWSEINNDDDVILTSGLSMAANRIFVSQNLREGEDWSLDSIAVALFIDCPISIDFDEHAFKGRPACCGGHGRIYIDLEELLQDDSDESIIKNIEWSDLN